MNSTNTTAQFNKDGSDQPYITVTTTKTQVDTQAANYTQDDVDANIAKYQALTDQWKKYKAMFTPQQ